MSGLFAVIVEGEGLDISEFSKPKRRAALARAINKTTRDQRAALARKIRKSVNLPASYVSPSQGRLAVVQQATPASLSGTIRARGRATSLARFTQGRQTSARGGVYVSVKPGASTFLRRAFLIRLRSGSALTDTQSNLGLAIRLRPGESIKGKTRKVRMANGLTLLYGPSVYQMLYNADGDGLAKDAEPEIIADVTEEFLRLMDL